jgi:hypothetical protein
MGYPQTAVPKTAHAVWYAYSIHVNGVPLGSFEKFGAKSTRTVERIREILFSRGAEVNEIVWGGTDSDVDLSHVELYTASIYEALGVQIFALEDFNFPVTITEVMTLPTDPGGLRIVDYVDAVCSNWGKDLDVTGAKVIETMSFAVRKVQGRRTS